MAKAAKKSKFRIVMTVFLVVTLILIMMFSLAACHYPDITEYKDSQWAYFEQYVDELVYYVDFTEESLAKIEKLMTKTKQQIYAAETKDSVYDIVTKAEEKIKKLPITVGYNVQKLYYYYNGPIFESKYFTQDFLNENRLKGDWYVEYDDTVDFNIQKVDDQSPEARALIVKDQERLDEILLEPLKDYYGNPIEVNFENKMILILIFDGYIDYWRIPAGIKIINDKLSVSAIRIPNYDKNQNHEFMQNASKRWYPMYLIDKIDVEIAEFMLFIY